MAKPIEIAFETPEEFVEEALKLYAWSPEYEESFLTLRLCDPTWLKLTFKKLTRNKQGYTKRVVKVLCNDSETCLATFERFTRLLLLDEIIADIS